MSQKLSPTVLHKKFIDSLGQYVKYHSNIEDKPLVVPLKSIYTIALTLQVLSRLENTKVSLFYQDKNVVHVVNLNLNQERKRYLLGLLQLQEILMMGFL